MKLDKQRATVNKLIKYVTCVLKNFLLPKHISRDEIYRSIKEILVSPIVRGGGNVTGFRTVNVTESEETVNRSVCYYRNNQVHVLFGASERRRHQQRAGGATTEVCAEGLRSYVFV